MSGHPLRRIVVLLLALILVACESGSEKTTSAAVSAPPSSTATTSPTPSPVEVPDVEGLPIEHATDELESLGLLVATKKGLSRNDEPGSVTLQDPPPGWTVADGTTIGVTVAVPLPRVAHLVGRKLNPARNILRNDDFKVKVIRMKTTTQPHDLVISQRPEAKTEAFPGRVVTLVVWNNICTPGYSPCLPKGRGDYDCAGGEGEPPFTGFVRVTGFSDPYNLDQDGDGQGCE